MRRSLPHRQLRNAIVPQTGTMLHDHCRIGSLEIELLTLFALLIDHCRIGSLEMVISASHTYDNDHCRIGSLERIKTRYLCSWWDHCRIGSLEMYRGMRTSWASGSLPHRQLRKIQLRLTASTKRSLPHRQLRNPHRSPRRRHSPITAA